MGQKCFYALLVGACLTTGLYGKVAAANYQADYPEQALYWGFAEKNDSVEFSSKIPDTDLEVATELSCSAVPLAQECDGIVTCKNGKLVIKINGYKLSDKEAARVIWLSKNVLPKLVDHKAQDISLEKKIDIAAKATWWSLREGVLGASKPYQVARYNLCHRNGRDVNISKSPLDVCHRGAWQVGIAASQVRHEGWSDEDIFTVSQKVYGVGYYDPQKAVTISLQLAGYDKDSDEYQGVVNSTGSLMRSWLLHNPVLAFPFVARYEVEVECYRQHKYWCFSGSYSEARRYSGDLSNVVDVITDLKDAYKCLL
jgi:hypothetical protein